MEEFIINFSEKDSKDAVREISSKTKSILSGPIKIFFIFFTPQYNPSILLENLKFTLNPEFLFGLQSPYLIFEDRIVEKGVIGLCINKKINIIENFIKEDEQLMEFNLRRFSFKLKEKRFFFSSISYGLNSYECIKTLELAFGVGGYILGGGFIKRYSEFNSQIINNNIGDGLLTIALSGIDIKTYKVSGFLPIGKPFIINKISSNPKKIIEINNTEPMNIFKYYFDDKFEFFKKKRLLSLYPFMIKQKDQTYFISIIDYLEDGSLLYVGDIRENTKANLGIYNSNLIYDSVRDIGLENNLKEGLAIIISTTNRKKILKNYEEREVLFIRNNLSNKYRIIGFYVDYSFLSNQILRRIITDSVSLVLTFWR